MTMFKDEVGKAVTKASGEAGREFRLYNTLWSLVTSWVLF